MAIRKHGVAAFAVEAIAHGLSAAHLDWLEEFLIRTHKTLKPFGYNLASGGNRPVFHQETRLKISESKKGLVPWNKGTPHSAATRAAISAANLGKKRSTSPYVRTDDIRRRISAALTGKPGARKGTHASVETKAKLSAARRGRPGKPHTDEWKETMRQRMIGNANSLGKAKPQHWKQWMGAFARKRERNEKGQWV